MTEHETTIPPSCSASVSSMSRDFAKLKKAFKRSWMSYADCVAFLDEERVRRQNALVLDDAAASEAADGWRADQGPFAFSDLVSLARTGTTDVAAVPALTIGCALIAELLAAVFNESRRAGAVFEMSLEQPRGRLQKGLLALRNAVCHPGYLPKPVTDESHVDVLAALLPSEQLALRRALLQDRRQLLGVGVARWTTAQVDALGRLECAQALADRLVRRGIDVSLAERQGIDKRAKDHDGFSEMVGKVDKVASGGQLTATTR